MDIRRIFYWMDSNDLRAAFRMSEKPDLRTHFNYWRKLMNSDIDKAWSIYIKEIHMGNCGIKHIDDDSRKCEFWIYIGEEKYRGQGVGCNALRAFFSLILNDFNFSLIYLHVSKDNSAAIRLYEKVGFEISQEGVSDEWKDVAGIIRMERSL